LSDTNLAPPKTDNVEQMISERRGRRIRVSWSLRYRRVGSTTWLPARTLNMSISGVLLQATPPPAPAERVELRIVVVPPSPLPATVVYVIGRVVRHESAFEGAAAVEFQSQVAWSPCRSQQLAH
jgi:hypothetical protein